MSARNSSSSSSSAVRKKRSRDLGSSRSLGKGTLSRKSSGTSGTSGSFSGFRDAAKEQKEAEMILERKEQARQNRLKARGPSRVRKVAIAKKKIEMVGDIDVVRTNKFLNSLDEDWVARLEQVNQIAAYLENPDISDEEWYHCLNSFRAALGRQFEDPRSIVIKNICDPFKNILMSRPELFHTYLPFFLGKMANCFSTRIAVIRNNAQALAIFCAVNVPDPEPEYPIAKYIMEEGMKHRQADTRCTFIRMFNILMQKFEPEDPETESDLSFLELIEQQVIRGVNDAGVKSRDESYKGLHIFSKINRTKYMDIKLTLSKAKVRRYDEVTKNL